MATRKKSEQNRNKTKTKIAKSHRDEKGLFLPGNPGGPGRPKGSIDFMATIREFAKKEGLDVRQMVWEAGLAMFQKAKEGDATAAKLVFDRACGVIEKGVDVDVNVTNVNASIGPTPPTESDMGRYIKRLTEVAAHQGIRVEDDDDE